MTSGAVRILYVDIGGIGGDLAASDLLASDRAEGDLSFVGRAQSLETAAQLCASLTVDVLLIRCELPSAGDVAAIKSIRANFSRLRIVILAQSDEPGLARSLLNLGVSGYLLAEQDLPDLATSIRAVHSGLMVCSATITQNLLRG